MKANIKVELHAKTISELSKSVKDLSEEIRVLRLDHTMGKLKNISSIGNKRVELSVVKTILREKLLAEKVREKEEKGGKNSK